MKRKKLTKADLDRVRGIQGFPAGSDADIAALSDAPCYTACPNPFLSDFIQKYGTPYDAASDDYHREPFAADVSEGKNDPVYMAHSYHTTVPHKAIMRYVAHYTDPGDIVLDGFCGTGMTGVACEALAAADSDFVQGILHADKAAAAGARHAILCDLSPAATFIASHYNLHCDPERFYAQACRMIEECEQELGWMFETLHTAPASERQPSLAEETEARKGRINYTVLSDVLVCPACGAEIVFWDAAVDHEKGKVSSSFFCRTCHALLQKRDCRRAVRPVYDAALKQVVNLPKQIPVLINYSYAGKRYEKKPDAFDIALLDRIDRYEITYPYPADALPSGDKTSDPFGLNIRNVHQFYTRRNLAVLAAFAHKARGTPCFVLVHSVSMVNTKMYRYRWAGGFAGAGGGPLSGTLYIPSLIKDINICKSLSEYARKVQKAKQLLYALPESSMISTQSATDLRNIPDNSCDYIFTDPPFGDNLMYSELSFLWEAWLKVKTDNTSEAVINKSQHKQIGDYQAIMTRCFCEYFRVLKPNRWLTVEFHNSKNAVWNAIQTALQRSGFVVGDVRTIDKKQVSFNQGKSASQAIKQDLIISAYKPAQGFLSGFGALAGTAESAFSFVQQHLANIPVVVMCGGKIERIAERQAYLLFDRMVAYHIMNGIPVPLDAADFYRELDARFFQRDGMYFLADQISEYDTARIQTDVEPVQLQMSVTNERSAISWLYQQLAVPQTYAQLQPRFMQEIKTIDRFEAMPELSVLLEENFLQCDDGRWYIPDVSKEADVAKLREKRLLKEFEGYLTFKGKLRLFRAEAVRAGFAKLWADKNYKRIVETAERLPESTIQEDDKLLMYYDISLGRV